eukprot:6193258-Pleurochrysis_carterae.AAC.1
MRRSRPARRARAVAVGPCATTAARVRVAVTGKALDPEECGRVQELAQEFGRSGACAKARIVQRAKN